MLIRVMDRWSVPVLGRPGDRVHLVRRAEDRRHEPRRRGRRVSHLPHPARDIHPAVRRLGGADRYLPAVPAADPRRVGVAVSSAWRSSSVGRSTRKPGWAARPRSNRGVIHSRSARQRYCSPRGSITLLGSGVYTARRDSVQCQDSSSAVSWPEQRDLLYPDTNDSARMKPGTYSITAD